MATRKEYQLAVGRATTAVRAKTQTLNEAQQTLSEAQETLTNLQSRSTDIQNEKLAELRTQSLLNAQLAVQNAQNAVTVAGSELRQAKTDLTSAQLELNNPDQVFDPEPVRASDAVTLTQEQRNRLDQINADRLEKDLLPLTPGDPAALAAVNASFAAEQTTQAASNRATASSQTAGDAVANTQGSVVPTLTIKEQALQNWNAVLAEGNKPPVGMDDPGFLASYERAIAANPSLGVDSPSVEPERNTGTSTGDFIEAAALSSAEAAKVERQVDPTDTGGANEFGGAPIPKEGWTNDGKGFTVTMSGTNSSTKTAPTTVGSKFVKAYPNPLLAYPTYTYGLSLHALTRTDFNNLTDNPTTKFKPTKTLISSANRYNTTRDKAFTDDFYFDNLKFSTVIGLSSSTRGTNAMDISFTLLEPYGMTLVNRLLDLSVSMKEGNYMVTPYLLEINFFGSDDSGKIANLTTHSKMIPIRIVAMKIKASTRGSEYVVSAVPYHAIAQLQSIAATKANFEITGKTIAEYFKNNATGSDAYSATQKAVTTVTEADAAAKKAQEQAKQAKDSSRDTVGSSTTALPPVPKAKITSNSFADAWNAWQATEVQHGSQMVADKIIFDIDSEIAAAEVIDTITVDPKTSSMTDMGGVSEFGGAPTPNPIAKQDLKTGSPKPTGADFKSSIFNINAGTSLTTVLNNALLNSSFVRKQLINPETTSLASVDVKNASADKAVKDSGGKKDVQWFKITSKVKLLNFDTSRNCHGKEITIYVRKYTHYNERFPYAPKSQPSAAIKNYNYIYTGENDDVIDFNINFDYLFVTQLNVGNSKSTAVNPNPGQGQNSTNRSNNKVPPLTQGTVGDTQVVHTSGSSNAQTSGADTSDKLLAANFAENIYVGAKGDMINLDLKIIGDPHFIKQDEIFFSASKNPIGQFIDREGGSLAMDSGEIFCNVSFKTPVDVDETTGLLRKDSNWKDVYFSGFYRVMTVQNEFSKGKFTQVLKLTRQPNQAGDSKGSTSNNTNSAAQRTDPTAKGGSSSGAATVAGNPASGGGNAGGTRGVEPNTVTQTYGEFGESIQVINDNANGKQYRRLADGTTEEIPQVSGPAPDRPGPDPLQQAARDNAGVVDDHENAGMSSAPTRLPLPDELSADPNQAALRNVAQNGPTGTIDTNSADTGEPIVGAPSASTQAAAPPQPAPVVNAPVLDPAATTPAPAPATQAPPVQTAPQPAPSTAAQRESTAALAQLDSITKESEIILAQSQAASKAWRAAQTQSGVLARAASEKLDEYLLISNPGTVAYKPELVNQLKAAADEAKRQSADFRAGPLAEALAKMKDLSQQYEDIYAKIETLKANSPNTEAELNAALDAVDAQQRSRTTF